MIGRIQQSASDSGVYFIFVLLKNAIKYLDYCHFLFYMYFLRLQMLHNLGIKCLIDCMNTNESDSGT